MGDNSGLSSKIAKFNAKANEHLEKQAVNPFSNENVRDMERRRFSGDQYGRPVRGSLTETRGIKATALVCKEMLQLCEVINDFGEPLFEDEDPSDTRKVISFGELFSMYTSISNKLVGILLRSRKHKIIDFEGECLFQRRDDHVPVILMKPIEEIRAEFHEEIDSALTSITDNKKGEEQLSDDDQDE